MVGLAVGTGMALLSLAKPAYINVERDGLSFRDHWPWSGENQLNFKDVRCFEYERVPGGKNNSSWKIVAIVSSAVGERRIGLPVLGRRPFATLKNALAEWQTAHDCLEPPRFADFAENVRL